MKSLSVSFLAFFLFASIAAFAQEPEELFANACIDPGLPAPLVFPSGKTPPLPTDRVSELTVTVTIAVFSLLRRSGRL